MTGPARTSKHPKRMPKPAARIATVAAPAVLFALTAALPACSAYEAPRFQVIHVQESARTTEGAVLTFTIAARNRNDVELPLRETTYALDLDGVRVFQGERSPEATIRPFGTQTFRLPVTIPADRFDLAQLDSGGDLPYRLTGNVRYQTPGEFADVLFDSGVRRPNAPIALRGKINLD
ncbi:MAG: LEA type 2 family protein [Planctomycetota bacterium]